VRRKTGRIDGFRSGADAAAEQMGRELAAAQACATAAEERAQAAEADSDPAVAQVRADAGAKVRSAEARTRPGLEDGSGRRELGEEIVRPGTSEPTGSRVGWHLQGEYLLRGPDRDHDVRPLDQGVDRFR
jgi:hypothetical protein